MPLSTVSLSLADDKSFKSREDFSSGDEYARYGRDSISMGMIVRCCEGYKEVCLGDIGRIMKVGVQVPLLVVLSGDVTQVLGHCCLCTLCHEYCVCLLGTTMILLTPHTYSYKSLCCIVLSIAVSSVLVIFSTMQPP